MAAPAPYSSQWWAQVFQQTGFNPYTQAPQPQAPPFDANLANRLGLLDKNFASQNAGFDATEAQTKQRYGLDDSSDPHSQLAQLKQAFETRRRGSGNSLAARGQFNSGAMNNAATANQQSFDQNFDSLRKAQNDALARIASQRAQTKSDYESGKLDAQDAATNNALQNRPDGGDFQPPLAGPPKPPSPTGAALRRQQRASIGITDIRRARPRQVRRARRLGYL